MADTEPKSSISLSTRLTSYLFPPAGLILLWFKSQVSLGRKIFSSIGILLYCVIYIAGVLFLMWRFGAIEVEWQGGFPPVLTFHKTVPNYDAVEADRAKKALSKNVKRSLAALRSAYWDGFRGPKRDGHYTQQSISTEWPAPGLPVLWKQPCGAGYASFAIAEGLVFTIEQRREQEVIVAYDVENGHEVWTQSYNARFDEPMGGEGPRATPTYSDGKIYSLGAFGELFCCEAATGKVFWRRNILAENKAELLTYATSASPLVVENKLIVCPGGTNGGSVVAYDKVTGEPIWNSQNDKAAYSSPMLVELAGETQLLVACELRVIGLKPEDGSLLWEIPWVVNQWNRNNSQPIIVSSNRFVLSAGYGTGAMCVEVSKTGSHFSAVEVWRNKNLKNKFNSSVFWNGHIYGLDEDILVCIDAKTGERKWKDGRYGYGQLALASGHLIILAGDGDLALVKATPEKHEELLRFSAITGKTWNHPAFSDGKLFVRNMVEMACFDISRK